MQVKAMRQPGSCGMRLALQILTALFATMFLVRLTYQPYSAVLLATQLQKGGRVPTVPESIRIPTLPAAAPPLPTIDTKHFLTPPPLPTATKEMYNSACKRLLANPLRNGNCKRGNPRITNAWRTPFCRDGNVTFLGQYQQDYYVYMHHFRHLRRRGVYLDVAAHEPISISNTWVMDACLGWDGVCVEASRFYIERLAAARTCRILPTCVGDTEGEAVSFVLARGRSGIAATNKNMEDFGEEVETLSLRCTTIGGQLKGAGIKRVDYMSLDVEGHEMHVLRGIDWGAVRINVMTVEVAKRMEGEMVRFMKGKGYKRHLPTIDEGTRTTGKMSSDIVFLHEDVVWGKPM